MGTIPRSIAQSARGKILCVLILAISFSLNAQVTKEQIAKSIQIEKLQHPYLFFTKGDIPAILKRIESDQECKDIMASLKVRAHRWLYFQIKDPAPLPPKHPRYVVGGNPAFSYYQELTEGGLTLAFLYQLTGDLTYAKKAIAFAVAMSDLPDWTDDTHKFDIIYPRVWPRGVPDDRVVFSLDCWGPEKASTVSTIYDWVYPVLTKWERDKIRGAILEKAITKVRGNYEFFWWSYAYRCNWSVICNNGLGLSALTLLKEDPQLIDVVAESYNRIGRTLDNIDEDGGWQEGRGYYQVLLRLGAPFMGALQKVSKGTYNLFQHKNLKDHPLDFLLYGLTAGFGDGGGGPMGPAFMVNKLVEESGSASGAWYREKFVNPRYERYPNSGVFDIIWPRPSVKPVEPKVKSKLFRGVNWAVMRSDFLDPSSVTIACKAGYNDDPHHGHLDCGHFVLTWQGVPFIRDIPGGGYDELYFNEDRWLYPGASSAGHNVIIVNDEQQISAKLKNQPWKEGIGGEILDFRTSDKRDYVLMDPTHAYPGKELKKWRRNIILEKPVVTVILDEVGASPGSTIEARFFPSVAPTQSRTGGGRGEARAPSSSVVGVDYKLLKDHVLMSSQRRTMVLIPLVLENSFKIVENALPAQAAREEEPLTWIPYFETVTTANSSTSIIVTLVLPVNDQKEAEAMVKTAKLVQSSPSELEASVSTSSGTLKWVFAKDKDGYALKD
ncbi:MAG: heparinase II/III family protein [Ignavibacteriales bacterium]|nr:heparinase II/III family protein [Ignavibacteriales bacterium]